MLARTAVSQVQEIHITRQTRTCLDRGQYTEQSRGPMNVIFRNDDACTPGFRSVDEACPTTVNVQFDLNVGGGRRSEHEAYSAPGSLTSNQANDKETSYSRRQLSYRLTETQRRYCSCWHHRAGNTSSQLSNLHSDFFLLASFSHSRLIRVMENWSGTRHFCATQRMDRCDGNDLAVADATSTVLTYLRASTS